LKAGLLLYYCSGPWNSGKNTAHAKLSPELYEGALYGAEVGNLRFAP